MIPARPFEKLSVMDLLEAMGYFEYAARKAVRYYFKKDEVLGPLLQHIAWKPNGGQIWPTGS